MLWKGEEAQDTAEYIGEALDMGLGQEGLHRIATSKLRHKEWGSNKIPPAVVWEHLGDSETLLERSCKVLPFPVVMGLIVSLKKICWNSNTHYLSM